MGILLFLVGLLAVGSGGIKLRHRGTEAGRVARLAVWEIVVGGVVVIGSGLGLSRVRPAAWTVAVVTLALIFVSTRVSVRSALRDHARRQVSEGARLQRHLEADEGRRARQ